jgi:hypothetical protein
MNTFETKFIGENIENSNIDIESQLTSYYPEAIPPDWNLAKIHGVFD